MARNNHSAYNHATFEYDKKTSSYNLVPARVQETWHQ